MFWVPGRYPGMFYFTSTEYDDSYLNSYPAVSALGSAKVSIFVCLTGMPTGIRLTYEF